MPDVKVTRKAPFATTPLDLAEIEAWLEAMAGEHDERLAHLREIAARLGA